MSRFLVAVGIGITLCTVVPTASAADQPVVHVDLQANANTKTSAYFPDDANQNKGAGGLPRGKHTFGGVSFLVGEDFIQLGGKRAPRKPEKVEGIAVGAAAKKLHFLHATCFGTVLDDEVIGKYVVNYDDKSQETIDIVYGQDLRDWYRLPENRDVTRGKTVWSGYNPRAASQGCTVRLYLTTWKNPQPAKRIATLDFLSMKTDSAPFCIAVTLDQK